jgi:drug/metabolite transporter (DMT)-like permease
MKRHQVIGLIAQVFLFGAIFIIGQFISNDQSATMLGLFLAFLCGLLFKYAGDYRKNGRIEYLTTNEQL